MIRAGEYEKDHKRISKVVRKDPHLKGFLDVHYLKNYYDNVDEFAKVVVSTDEEDNILGFVCFRNLKRNPGTTIYFMGVFPEARRQGVASELFLHVAEQAENSCVVMRVENDNQAALAFWRSVGVCFGPGGTWKDGTPYVEGVYL